MTTKRERKYSQDFSGDSVVQQQFKESCNVNNIVRHYEATGIDPHAERIGKQTFGYATSKTYEEASRNLAEINSAFADLPSATRALHHNDPKHWIDALQAVPTPEVEIDRPEASQEASPPEDSTPEKPEA